jgi:L-lactate dehydrogenase complex protein LldE
MKVNLFVTCLVDQFFPEVGIDILKIMRRSKVEVYFPVEQTCCGQPAFNNGFWQEARGLAKRFILLFEKADLIVIPSGSCASMVKIFYPVLFKDDPTLLAKAQELSRKVYEFSEFLVKILGIETVDSTYKGKITYHDSCHLLRELEIYKEPRKLLRAIKGIDLIAMEKSEACCGFGGMFSIKNPGISTAILQEKIDNIRATGAETIVANDAGCLMHIAGGLSRQNLIIKTRHIAQILAADE